MTLPLYSDAIDQVVEAFTHGWGRFELTGPVIVSLIIMGLVALISVYVGLRARFADPLKRPRGILIPAEMFVSWIESWVAENMGIKPGSDWGGYFMALFSYLFLSFIWSITGMRSVIDYLLVPFTLSCVMFVIIQVTALKTQKLRYFHRYIEPVVFWLPINLITMWAPIISTSLRMFGNAIAGSVILALIDWALQNVSVLLFSSMGEWGRIWLSPVPLAVLNLYFSLFSGFVQTLVFASLNAVWIGGEIPSPEPMGVTGQAMRPEANKAHEIQQR